MKKDLKAVFVAEGRGLLKSLREGLAAVQERPQILPELFRWAHTLKGDVKLAGSHELALVIVPLADILRMARDRGSIDPERVELVKEAVAACERLVEGGEVPRIERLVESLKRAAVAQPAPSPRRSALTVLLIEDSALQRRLVQTELGESQAGVSFSVQTADRLAAGLDRISRGGIDAVLLDLNLPDSQGVSSFITLSGQAPTLPVVILTISDDDAMAMEALRKGAQDYLVKNLIDGQLLSRVIRYAIERKRLETSLRMARESLELRVSERTAELTMANRALTDEVVERRRVEAELRLKSADLERSNTELALFASVAAHELQEPLRKIVNWGDLLKRHCAQALEAKGLELLDNMQKAAIRQGELIRSLRDLTRVTTATRPLEPLDLESVIKDVVSEMAPMLDSIGGRVEVGSLPSIRGDAVQMGQLFYNLIGNSAKFREPQRTLSVKVAARSGAPGFIEIDVEDNGIGFEQRYAEQLFRPFQRLHGRGKYEGTGMGLAICARIAWRHGGAISARSEPDKGSTFTVTLPELEPVR